MLLKCEYQERNKRSTLIRSMSMLVKNKKFELKSHLWHNISLSYKIIQCGKQYDVVAKYVLISKSI